MANPQHLAILQSGVEEWNKGRLGNRGADLHEGDLSGADLNGMDLSGVDFRGTNLNGANLGGANLRGANLQGTNLHGTNLRWAILNGVNLTGAELSEAYLGEAYIGETVFANVDLKDARGVDKFIHEGPSTIDHRTLALSGTLPLVFLRGCGLPDTLIDSCLHCLMRRFSSTLFHQLFDRRPELCRAALR